MLSHLEALVTWLTRSGAGSVGGVFVAELGERVASHTGTIDIDGSTEAADFFACVCHEDLMFFSLTPCDNDSVARCSQTMYAFEIVPR